MVYNDIASLDLFINDTYCRTFGESSFYNSDLYLEDYTCESFAGSNHDYRIYKFIAETGIHTFTLFYTNGPIYKTGTFEIIGDTCTTIRLD